jgi:hypothetical protein
MHKRSPSGTSVQLTPTPPQFIFQITMGRWSIKPSVRATLLGMLFLIFLILVLPDVDLPDAAFHSGTAPVTLHASAVTPPSVSTVAAVIPANLPAQPSGAPSASGTSGKSISVDSLPILHRSLRC